MGASRLSNIAQVLDVPASYFFKRIQGAVEESATSHVMRGTDEIARFVSSTDGVHLNRAFLQIRSPTPLHKVVSLVRSVMFPSRPVPSLVLPGRGARARACALLHVRCGAFRVRSSLTSPAFGPP